LAGRIGRSFERHSIRRAFSTVISGSVTGNGSTNGARGVSAAESLGNQIQD
jgi:hypothetical protein